MVLDFNIFYWLVSALPIVLLISLMMGFKWSAIKAAPFTLMITILTSFFIFKGSIELLVLEEIKALWSSLSIVSVVITAILLYETSKEAKAFYLLNKAFNAIAPNELVRILLIGVVFASFLQGVTGFGVPVLVTAPLLIGIGVKPIWSVVIPLVGHCWAGTFGTLALAWHALILQTTLVDSSEAIFYTTVLLSILIISAGILIAYFYGKKESIKKGLLAVLAISLTLGLGQIIVAQINPDLGVFLPSAISFIVVLLLSKLPMYNKPWKIENSPIMDRNKESEVVNESNMNVFEAFLPYLVMTALTLIILLVKPLNELLGSIFYGPSFKETITGLGAVNTKVLSYAPIKPFTHASFFLLISALTGYFYYRKKEIISKNRIYTITRKTFKKAIPSSIAVISLLSISRILTGTGQTSILAYGVSSFFGEYYTIFTPFVGLLGAFITSSNMSSNILFGGFQFSLANILDLNSSLLLGAQTAGGSIGTAIAPSNIVLGATTAEILGQEGAILKKILPFVLVLTSIFGIATFLIAYL
ncbi:MAG: L-lactate permease [Gudongella sp.]|nr:L-lactate permease [Gudongella sp.]